MKSQRSVEIRWLIVGSAAIASLIAAWLICPNLRIRPAPVAKNTSKLGEKNTLKKINAIITIRNGTTQQIESTGPVATRRLSKERPTAQATARVTAPPAMTVSAAPALSIQMLKKNSVQAQVPAAPTSASPATVIKLVPTPAARPLANLCPPSRVRVLTLPEHCGCRNLHQQWDDSFGEDDADDLVVWWPWNPANPPGPATTDLLHSAMSGTRAQR